MAHTGYVYNSGFLPKHEQGCAVHAVFHGCQQGAGEVGDYVYSKLGHNEWDDNNDMRRSLTSLLTAAMTVAV